jgi:hypothetical protein
LCRNAVDVSCFCAGLGRGSGVDWGVEGGSSGLGGGSWVGGGFMPIYMPEITGGVDDVPYALFELFRFWGCKLGLVLEDL